MAALESFERWLAQLRCFWSARVDALERYLDRMGDRSDQNTNPNGKAKQR
jgi:hypothetical protein